MSDSQSTHVSERRAAKTIVLKYFEDNEEYPKIIHKRAWNKRKNREVTSISGKTIISMVRKDDLWLETRNPIVAVLHYVEEAHKFKQIFEEEIFELPELENVFTLHVQRQIAVDRLIIHSTMVFSVRNTANDWISGGTHMMIEDSASGLSIRYYDKHYHGYARLGQGDLIPFERTGRTLVKLLFERRLPHPLPPTYPSSKAAYLVHVEDEDEVSEEVWDETNTASEGTIDQQPEDEYDPEEGTESDAAHVSFSDYVDLSKIPPKTANTNATLEMSKDNAWRKIALPTSRADVDQKVKNLIRLGIPEALRPQLWSALTGAHQLLHTNKRYYQTAFNSVYSYGDTTHDQDIPIDSIDPKMVPEFGGHLRFEDHFLKQDGMRAVRRILCVIAEQYPDIEFCPALPDIVALLLLYLNEHEAYAAAHAMLDTSRNQRWYFRTNKMQHALLLETFNDLFKQKLPILARHFETVDIDLYPITEEWFDRMFVSHIPFHILVRVVDGFLHEGYKVLYRVALGILKAMEPHLLSLRSPNIIYTLLRDRMIPLNDEENFFKKIYRFTLRRDAMQELDDKNRQSICHMKLSTKSTTYYRPKIRTASAIITHLHQWETLLTWLPVTYRLKDLSLAFSTSRDGYSLSTLFHMCSRIGPSILLIAAVPYADVSSSSTETQNSETQQPLIIGAFATDSYQRSFQFYGQQDCFLFSLHPEEKVFYHSGVNKFYMMGARDKLTFGGGGEGAGLSIDEELAFGSTHRCDTFANDPLCSTTSFNILKLEIYTFS